MELPQLVKSSHSTYIWTGWLVAAAPVPRTPAVPPTRLPGGHGRMPSEKSTNLM